MGILVVEAIHIHVYKLMQVFYHRQYKVGLGLLKGRLTVDIRQVLS